jgi:hypothetical protein
LILCQGLGYTLHASFLFLLRLLQITTKKSRGGYFTWFLFRREKRLPRHAPFSYEKEEGGKLASQHGSIIPIHESCCWRALDTKKRKEKLDCFQLFRQRLDVVMLCTLLKEQQQPPLFGERGRTDFKKIKIKSIHFRLNCPEGKGTKRKDGILKSFFCFFFLFFVLFFCFLPSTNTIIDVLR